MHKIIVFAKGLAAVIYELWGILIGGMQFIVWIAISQTFDIGFWKFLFFITFLTTIVPIIRPSQMEKDNIITSLTVEFIVFWIAIFMPSAYDDFECFKLLSTYREVTGPLEFIPVLTCCCGFASVLRLSGTITVLFLYVGLVRILRCIIQGIPASEAEVPEVQAALQALSGTFGTFGRTFEV